MPGKRNQKSVTYEINYEERHQEILGLSTTFLHRIQPKAPADLKPRKINVERLHYTIESPHRPMLKGAILTMKGRFQILLTDFKSNRCLYTHLLDTEILNIVKLLKSIPKTLCSMEFKYCSTNPKVSRNKIGIRYVKLFK